MFPKYGPPHWQLSNSVPNNSIAIKFDCSLFPLRCHAQSLAATNRVTEQLSWLTVESSFMSCSISWMASLIDNLYLLNLIVLVINWQRVNSRGTIRGDPQETLYCIRSPILFVRSIILTCNHNEAERSVWVICSSSEKEQQCGSHAKLSRHRVVDTLTCVQRAQGHEPENR
jgi:hypothetical protein